MFEQVIEQDLYEGLVILDSKGKVKAGAASRWEISTDATHYTFRLRPGLHWSNGDVLTAADFVYSFRRLVNPATKSPNAFLAYPIQNATEIATGKNPNLDQLGVEAVGDDTVRITLSVPTPYFLAALTNSCFSPVNQKSVAHFGDDFSKPGNLIGGGAYVLQEWTPRIRLVLKRNPRYWDAEHVKIAEVQYLAMPVVSEEYQHYLAGEIDITWDVPTDKIAFVRANRPGEFRVVPHFGIYYYAIDLASPPFKDHPGLRQSLAMTIDRELITRQIVGGGEPPAYSWVPSGLSGYTPQTMDWKNLSKEQRLAQANRLYAEAG